MGRQVNKKKPLQTSAICLNCDKVDLDVTENTDIDAFRTICGSCPKIYKYDMIVRSNIGRFKGKGKTSKVHERYGSQIKYLVESGHTMKKTSEIIGLSQPTVQKYCKEHSIKRGVKNDES